MDKIGGDKMKILFMTVGTGVGMKEEKIKNLAHGLLVSILTHTPDKIIFFGSEESKKTLEEIKKQYVKEKGEELEKYEFVKIKNIDDFYECYVSIENKIKEFEGNEVIIDYTSGTKTMTTSAAIIAMLYQKRLFITSGRRGLNGIVLPGTEEVKSQNLFAAYDKYLMDKAKEAFNSYRYEEAKNYLGQIVAIEEKNEYLKLVETYDLWDKFNHEKAKERMDELEVKDEVFNTNKSFLGRLQSAKKKGEVVEKFLIPDLINNAYRRIEEGKYDDAVARLYRCVEMIAQYRLKSVHNLNPSEIKFGDLETTKSINNLEKYKDKKNDAGIIKLAMKNSFELLKDLKDEVGNIIDDKELKELLKKRNLSILAHGIEPVTKEDAEKFYKKVLEISKSVISDLEKSMKWAEFPKL